jgi:hypothetical protein
MALAAELGAVALISLAWVALAVASAARYGRAPEAAWRPSGEAFRSSILTFCCCA